MDKNFFNMLGLCRRAGKLSIGHDAVISSIVKKHSKLCILCNDVSVRLANEINHAASFDNNNIPVVRADFSIEELYFNTNIRAGVISIDDNGFAQKIIALLR